MADFELNGSGKNIAYPSLDLFLKGGTSSGKSYPKVDMSLWDQATMCATCHVGGAFYEHDRTGLRLPLRQMQDMGMNVPAMGITGSPEINPLTTTVWEQYTRDAKGTDISYAGFAPWIYQATTDNQPTAADTSNAMGAPFGWGQSITAGPYAGQKQLMMPNVKEMDCLFCHLKGYNNVMSTVMVQAGSLNAAPAAGAGLFDMFPGSPTYMGYDASKVTVTDAPAPYTGMKMVSLSGSLLPNIFKKPDSDNCMQCHATKTLKDLPEMFGTTGTSNGFLSSAPMIYDPGPYASGPLGRRMVSYDIDSPWMASGASDPIRGKIDVFGNISGNFMGKMMPGMSFLRAMGPTPFNAASYADPKFLGGNNPAMTGPLFYYAPTTADPFGPQDQGILKYSIEPFPRAEWFKRGDAWQVGQDVHAFGCGGCHYTSDSTHKSQCDPGRGFDMASGIQDGVPPLKNRNLVTEDQNDGKGNVLHTPDMHDTRNTVKRCEFCHITGKDYYGQAIETYGAVNPTSLHAAFGLISSNRPGGFPKVQIADKIALHGTFGGQGVATVTNFTDPTTRLNPKGGHLDIMDCTVCHVQKSSMVVRALDATSGSRFPVVLGTDMSKGMMGLFENPAPTDADNYAKSQYNGMYTQINLYFGYTGGEPQGTPGAAGSPGAGVPGPGYQTLIPTNTPAVGGKLQEWKPMVTWQKLGNMELPLTTNLGAGADFANSGASQMNFRRKLYLTNCISAVLWNNADPAVDANGDGAPGGLLIGDDPATLLPRIDGTTKTSLVGYRDIFSGDPPDANNTQGFGDPIYDPWIMRDLKAGFNFGPAGFAPISIGFGGFGTPTGVTDPTGGTYQRGVNIDGTFSGSFKFASVWSGAVIFTEPDQIKGYKDYRTAMEQVKPAAERKPWTKTELAYVGAPFMVTHGVKKTSAYVKGKSCADCHAPGAGFFDGGFNMVGSAIPADQSYNPVSMTGAVVGGQFVPGAVDENGDYQRVELISGMGQQTNMMQRPLEWIPRIKAFYGDLATGYEGFNKLGQPRTVKFQKDSAETITDGSSTHPKYSFTTELSKADVIYPPEDGAIYYKITDLNADGTLKATHGAPMTGTQYADYLDHIAMPANAAITSITPSTTDATYGKTVTLGATETLTADTTGNGADTTYSWIINDATDANGYGTTRTLTGTPITTTFGTAGRFNVTLLALNPVTKEMTQVTQTLYVKPAPVDAGNADIAATTETTADPAVTKLTLAMGASFPAYTKVKISWGDGAYTGLDTTNIGGSITHAYKRLAQYLGKEGVAADHYGYKTKLYFYNGNALAALKEQVVDLTTTSDLVLNARMIRLLDRTTNSYLVRKGSAVYLVISLFNKGPGTNHINSVTIPAVPAPLTVLSSSANMGSLSGTTWTIDRNLAKGQTATLTLKVLMSATAATTKFNYPAAAGTLTVDSTLPDSVPAGSVASEPVAGFAVTPY